MSEPPMADAIAHWLRSRGWKGVTVTENFVLVLDGDPPYDAHVWSRDWIQERAGELVLRTGLPEHYEVTACMQNIVMTAIKSARR